MQSVDLLLSSGTGPAECRIALSRLVGILQKEATQLECSFEMASATATDKHGPKSVLITLEGDAADQIARDYCGTIKFIFKSPVRPQHKRQNWFVSVSKAELTRVSDVNIRSEDVRYEALRAGGPGGQHQNTTDSAVRIVHIPTGIQLIARNERSQHRNKAAALDRLKSVLQHFQDQELENAKAARHQDNRNIERGNEIKSFRF
ncbi:peptide chain release factor H [Rhizobiales bacterium]|uniref:peptide chain release factor H n=1 Tax=Pseudochrobactrum asaccharolyticum TaxID=354351 RepID=UPI000EFA4260